ncbi:serine threonine dehydratase [Raphidocelis subcapitata]|uniref:Serine threonine dehydratase n=1 Tax=Raphidocelis subcapitata TaxID=307507 RepID=A0A2V0PNH2_9CHLO|nr:serine threonine dehydratase [Raphidocelis subcapitata]|eukprot:GBF99480.1 serine threonine dehydratase [Raphidocelis subcapitata]
MLLRHLRGGGVAARKGRTAMRGRGAAAAAAADGRAAPLPSPQTPALPADLAAASAAAAVRIAPYIRHTPLEPSPWLSGAGRCVAYLKLESEQATGSFKARGAVNRLLTLPQEQLERGLVTCSTGNHALAFLHAARAVAAGAALPRSLVYLPRTASAGKVGKLRARGARITLFGDDCVDTEAEARRVAGERGMVYISPYNDWEVMAGQGTVAMEILQQLEEAEAAAAGAQPTAAAGGGGAAAAAAEPGGPAPADDGAAAAAAAAAAAPLVVYVPVGGGGLIGGMAAALKHALGPRVRVVGCSPEASDVMRRSVEAGRIVDAPTGPTLSDATAGGIEEGALTLAPCAACVDEWVNVSEQEIADAMASLLFHHSKLVEGAAGCAVAAFWRQRASLAGARAVVLCCGGNVAVETLREVLERGRVLHAEAAAAG